MLIIHSKQHKEIVGSVNDAPYVISFDADGFAEVEDSIALQLTSGRYGVVIIDEDGAEVTDIAPDPVNVADIAPDVADVVEDKTPDVSNIADTETNKEASVTEEKVKKTSKKSEGSEA